MGSLALVIKQDIITSILFNRIRTLQATSLGIQSCMGFLLFLRKLPPGPESDLAMGEVADGCHTPNHLTKTTTTTTTTIATAAGMLVLLLYHYDYDDNNNYYYCYYYRSPWGCKEDDSLPLLNKGRAQH